MYDSDKLKKAGGLSGAKENGIILKKNDLKKWEKDKDFILKDILYAKFSQNKRLKCILLSTGKSKLVHQLPRSRYIIYLYI